MQNRIVVLYGSAFGKRALPFALAVARRSHTAVEIVHVHERPPVASGAPSFDTGMDAEWRASMRQDLTRLAAQVTAEAKVKTSARFLDGEIVPALHQLLSQEEAILVVMMTHGRGGLSRYWLGSVAERLIRVSPVPVLLLRAGSEWPGKLHEPFFVRILVPVDDSDTAAEVLGHAFRLGQPGETSLALITVVDPALPPTAQVAAEQRLAALGDDVSAHAFDVKSAVLSAEHVAPAILAFAEEKAIDLIALATHAHGHPHPLFLGSTADKVIRGADMPVLVYRPRGAGNPPLVGRQEAHPASRKG